MSCYRTDKLRYPGRKAAAHFAAAARARTVERITPYHCRACHCWHIGHPSGWNTMAALKTISVDCPACGTAIAAPLSLHRKPGYDEDGAVVMVLELDPAPIDEHCKTHALAG